ncbi:MAG: DUF2752 domain-containing protein [Planctomycetota bacterium]
MDDTPAQPVAAVDSAAESASLPRETLPASAPRRALPSRLVALFVFLPTTAVLLTAAGLTPAERGIGTHTQLGLQPCGFEAATGYPCATCGMTTSFTLAADGRFLDAFAVQPAGLILAVVTAMAAVLGGWALWSGMSLAALGTALWRPRVVVLLIGVVLLGWAYTAGRTAWGV